MELHSLESHYWLPMTTTGLLPRRVFPTLTIILLISSFRVGAPIVLLYPPSYIHLYYTGHTANASRVLGLFLKGDLCCSMKISHCSSPSLVTQLPFGLGSPHNHRIPTYLRLTTIVSVLLVVQYWAPVGPAQRLTKD